MAGFVNIPRSEFQNLLNDIQRGLEVCSDVSGARFALQALAARLAPDDPIRKGVETLTEVCKVAAQYRVDLLSLERRLRELDYDPDKTPLRPPSRTDIKAAFDASVDFASGKKKPP